MEVRTGLPKGHFEGQSTEGEDPKLCAFHQREKRDHFAAMALQGFLAAGVFNASSAAKEAVAMADALLKELGYD